MSERLPVAACQRRLAQVWLAGAAVMSALLIVQSQAGKYGEQADKAWSWFLAAMLPTLSLIVGAVAYEAKHQEAKATIDRFTFQMSFGLSLFYILCLLGVLLLQPFTTMTPLDLMRTSMLWLSPAQGLVGVALGVFFVSRRTSRS